MTTKNGPYSEKDFILKPPGTTSVSESLMEQEGLTGFQCNVMC